MGRGLVLFGCGLAASSAAAAPRDVQIRSIHFATGVIELHNYGAASEALSGWSFCTHDENQIRLYTNPGGFSGVVVAPGASLFVHFANDAPPLPEHVNRSSLGLFATPLDNGAYSMQLYFAPVNFEDGNTIADHLQWSPGGADHTVADERSDEAVAGGVWTNESAWIATSAGTTALRLLDVSGGVLHGPGDYAALDVMPDCNENFIDDFFDIADGRSQDANSDGVPDECQPPDCPDLDGNGLVDLTDLALLLANFGLTGPDLPGDVDDDLDVDLTDLALLLAAFGAACP